MSGFYSKEWGSLIEKSHPKVALFDIWEDMDVVPAGFAHNGYRGWAGDVCRLLSDNDIEHSVRRYTISRGSGKESGHDLVWCVLVHKEFQATALILLSDKGLI